MYPCFVVWHWLINVARRRHPHIGCPLPHDIATHTEPRNTGRAPTPTAPGARRLLRAKEARARANQSGSTRGASRNGQGQVEQEPRGGSQEGVHDRLEKSARGG